VDALVMCGGQGTRLRADVEKPRYRVGDEPMLDRVLRALGDAGVDVIHAAVSPHTPATRARLVGEVGRTEAGDASTAELPVDDVRVVDTPGEGYVEDLDTALAEIDRPVLTVTADLPLLAAEHVDRAIESSNRGEQSLTVRVPAALKRLLGATCEEALYGDAPTGLNVVGPTGAAGGTLRRYDARLAVNVNTVADARIAEALL